MTLLGGFPVAGVVRADDIVRAKRFYLDVLGLSESDGSEDVPGEVMLAAGNGTSVVLYERPGMPAPGNTVLGFGVPKEEFDKVMSELKGRGVSFEEYDIPEIGLRTVGGVAGMNGGRAAWFKDTEGNTLNIGTI